ncbi:MAG: hypothetical protein ACRYFU_02895 [Janthinobacterium lividum]
MNKPGSWTDQCVILEDTPYTQAEKVAQDNTHSAQGMLQCGRVVWRQATGDVADGHITVYADGIGLVSVDSNSLKGQ